MRRSRLLLRLWIPFVMSSELIFLSLCGRCLSVGGHDAEGRRAVQPPINCLGSILIELARFACPHSNCG